MPDKYWLLNTQKLPHAADKLYFPSLSLRAALRITNYIRTKCDGLISDITCVNNLTVSASQHFPRLKLRVLGKRCQLVQFPYFPSLLGMARKITSTNPASYPFQNLNSKFFIFLKSFRHLTFCLDWDCKIPVVQALVKKQCATEGEPGVLPCGLRPSHDSSLWLLSSYFPGKHLIPLLNLLSRILDGEKQKVYLTSSSYLTLSYVPHIVGFPRCDCSCVTSTTCVEELS